MIDLDDGTVVTAAEHAAGIVEGTASTRWTAVTKVISVRLPVSLFAEVSALAHKSGKTRNAMICTLLEVGVEEVTTRLTPETKTALGAIRSDLLTDLGETVSHSEE